MAVITMNKYQILVHKDEAFRLISIIHDLGVAELNEVKHDNLQSNEPQEFDHHRHSSRIDTALNFLSKFHKTKGLKAMIEGNRIHTTKENMESLVKKFDFEKVVSQVQILETKLNEINRNSNQLTEEYHLLHTWKRLALPLNESMETELTLTLSLRGTVRAITSFCKDLEEKTKLASIEEIGETTLMLSFMKDFQENINELISAHGLEKVNLPQNSGTVAEELIRIEKDKIKLEKTKGQLEAKARELSLENIDDLKVVSDYYLWKKEELDEALSAPSTDNVKVFTAWIPQALAEKIKEQIENEIPQAALETIAPDEGELPPTEIQNNGLITPFETVTRLYGLPTNKDLDPTPFLALFFFVFFGMSLGDVGYGLTLMAITGTVLWKYKLEATVKQLVSLLFYGGLGSILAGVILGGYLGINIEAMPVFLQKLQLLDPISSPLPIFYLSLALGFTQIVFGVFLKIVSQARNGDLKGGVLDNGPWLLLFAGLLLMIMNQFGILTQIITTSSYAWINWIIYASLGLIVLTQGRSAKGIFGKIFFGILSLYNIIGYFADTLSYSRLLALGLGTTALSFSINMIAQFIGSLMPSFLGIIVTVIILILGHTLNITISILGAFIHSARLQFVEFFSKFLIGSGRTFKPFEKLQRNVILIPSGKN